MECFDDAISSFVPKRMQPFSRGSCKAGMFENGQRLSVDVHFQTGASVFDGHYLQFRINDW
jgi:hypothetical protein